MSEENNTDTTFAVSEDDIAKAIDALSKSGSISKAAHNDDDDDDDDDDDKGGDKTNAKVEGEDEGGDNNDKDTYKAYKMKKGGGTYYRKMKKGAEGKDMEYADDKKYKKAGDGYKQMSKKEISGMEAAGGGKDKYKGIEKAELMDEVETLPNITIEKATEISELEKAEDIVDFIVNYDEVNDAIVKADPDEEEEEETGAEGEGSGEKEKEEDEEVAKALDVSPVMKKFNDTLNKALDSSDDNFKNMGVIMKGMFERMESMQERLDTIGKNAQPRKSAEGVTYQDRFGNKVEKAEGDNKVLHVVNDKLEILNLMDEITFKDNGLDETMSKAMTLFEGSGQIMKGAHATLEKEFGIQIVV